MSAIELGGHHPSRRNRISAAVLGASLLAVGLLLFTQTPVAAAPPMATPSAPGPSECTVAPRSLPLPVGSATPTTPDAAPAPFVQPTGTPADETTRAAVTATVRQSIACANGGELLRGLALYTDRFLANQLIGPNGITQENMVLLASTPPAAVPTADQLSLVAVQDVILLSDGRIGATVVTRNADGTFTDYLTFANVDGDWLIADAASLQSPNGTPTP